ncbi:RUN domain-containing protein 1, partial [Eurytemora carolleeae]|uniref:RUN domain-containing protein 1 n=1 Tax=Eurytemora carolleeae TaxID=1294199 RepID=UPI000C775866
KSQEPEKESSQSEERRSRTDQGRILEDQRRIEADAISTLKVKLEELESYAYQAGEATLPSSLVLQRQSVVLEQLKERLNIDVSDIARLSEDELKAEVDSKLCQFVNPLRMKSQLVSQLQTQIQDLEMFIHFIQAKELALFIKIFWTAESSERVRKIEEQKQTLNLLKKAVSVLQMTSTVTSLGCGSQKFKSNTLKGESGHYGDLLRDLLHHGLGQKSRRGSLLPFSGCMSGRSSTNTGIVHVWDVITRYYELKGGAEFNSAPARRLSRSFGLDLAPTVSNNKQVLLQTIGQILSSHSQYKRTPDQHFKAFVSAGLNKRKLVPWLRLILRNQTILETMYQPSSYVVTTGFDDGFHLLERLSLYVFNLPVNLAVKQFQILFHAQGQTQVHLQVQVQGQAQLQVQ